MISSCTLTPRNKKGEEPYLYKQLEDFYGDREKAKAVYNRVHSEEFRAKFPNLKLDPENNPSMKDLLKQFNLEKMQSEEDTLKNLNRKYESREKRYASIMDLQEEAVRFNNDVTYNDRFFASIEDSSGSEARIVIKPLRQAQTDEVKNLEMNFRLNRRLESLMNEWGVGIGALSKLEEASGINGIMDTNVAVNTATGLRNVVRIFQGKRGLGAIAEEFGHFVVDAIGDNPAKARMLRMLRNEDVLRRIYGDSYENYSAQYNGNVDLLAEEALGKLVAGELNNQNVFNPNKTLFFRYLDRATEFFASKDADDIDRTITEIRRQVFNLTNDIVNKRYNIRSGSPEGQRRFYSLNSSISKEQKLLQNIIDQEYKRLKIYGKNEKFSEAQAVFIKGLEDHIADATYIQGITAYMKKSLNMLNGLANKLNNINSGKLSTKEKFTLIRNIRNYTSSYGSVMHEIRKEMNSQKRSGDSRLFDQLSSLLDANKNIIENLCDDYYEIAKDLFAQFITPFVDSKLANTITRDKDKVHTAEEMLEAMDSDISLLDRYIDSMADSKDDILKIYDQIVKKQKGQARLDTIREEKDILKHAQMLKDAGIDNTDWMYARDSSGNLTGYFVQRTDWDKYYAAKKMAIDDIRSRYPENMNGDDKYRMSREISAWYKAHTHKDSEGMSVPNSEFNDPRYDDIISNSAKKAFYDYILDMKSHYDSFLPGVVEMRTPQIKRDLIQRMKNSNHKGKYLWESLKDTLVKREDDEDMQEKSVLMDFEGNQVMSLPVYYTRQLEDMNDLSTDIVSTMIAYASMANDYNRMNDVIDTLEVGRLVLENREVKQTDGEKTKYEHFKAFGKDIKKALTKKGDANFFMQKLNSFMEMQAYGMQHKDEGTILNTNIDKGKAVDLLNKMTSLSTTALSVLTGLANTAQNSFIDRVEASAHRFFSHSELTKGERIYMSQISGLVGQAGQRLKTNKLALFSEMFNVTQDYKNHIRDVDWNRNGWAKQLFNESALFFTTSFGDHFTQHRMALALAERMKLKDSAGNEISLWDALEVDEDAHMLRIKKGCRKLDGKEWTDDDTIAFSNKIRGIEDTLYGIYNSEDKNAIQQYGVGRLAMLYRNWMRPLLLARYGGRTYNYDFGDYTEGFYRTGGRFLKMLWNDLKKMEFHLVKDFDTLSPMEKQNMYKLLTEIGAYGVLCMVINLLNLKGDDDRDRPWALRLASYSVMRLRTDMGALMIGKPMVNEGLKFFESPFASISYVKKLIKLLDLAMPWEWDEMSEKVTSGPYKGLTRAEKIGIDVLPFSKPIVNVIDPDAPAKWYK